MKADKHADVNLYGEVVQAVPVDWWTGEKITGLFIELKQFLEDVEELQDYDSVTFKINSVGGDVEAGIAIYNRIRELKASTTTVVEGLAASAASIIAQAGDKREVKTGTQTMIHGAAVGLCGYYNLQDIQKKENMLDSINQSVAGIYAERTGKKQEEILEMMEKEEWMTPEKAVENGFADEITGKDEPVVDKVKNHNDLLIVNGICHRMAGMPIPKMAIHGVINKVVDGCEPLAINNKKIKKGDRKMDLQELKNTYPDLVKQIVEEANQTACTEKDNAVKDALEKDRARMKEIDEIANMIGDSELINKAKYEEPMEASALALAAMKSQQAAGNSYMNARKIEAEATNTVDTPVNTGMEDNVAQDAKELQDLINFVKEEM